MASHTAVQSTLDFIDLSTTDPRNEVRKVSLSRSERLHTINEEIMRIRPGKGKEKFNWRRKRNRESQEDYEKRLGIPELADAMHINNGPDDPIIGDFKDGLFYVNEGERRLLGIRYLIYVKGLDTYPNGSPICEVEILQNPREFTDKDRRRRIYTSQAKVNLSIMETAYGMLEMKTEDGMTHEEIAAELGVSRQTVDNYIAATRLKEEVQEEIDEGRIPMTTALAHDRQTRKKDKDSQRVVDEGGIPPEIFKKNEKTDKEKEDSEIPPQQDNTISSPATRLQEDKGSAAHVYNEPEEEIWKRALKQIIKLNEEERSVEYIIGELKLNFQIANRRM